MAERNGHLVTSLRVCDGLAQRDNSLQLQGGLVTGGVRSAASDLQGLPGQALAAGVASEVGVSLRHVRVQLHALRAVTSAVGQ